MLHEHIQVIDIDGRHWRNLLGAGRLGAPAKAKRSWMLVIECQGRTIKAVHSTRGVLRGWRMPPDRDFAAVRRDEQADTLWVVQHGAFARLFERAQKAMRFDMEYVTQMLHFRESLRLGVEGREIQRDPPWHLKPRGAERIRRVLDRLPEGHGALFYVFDAQAPDGIWTSLILRKKGGVIDLITTHDALRSAVDCRLPAQDPPAPAADAPPSSAGGPLPASEIPRDLAARIVEAASMRFGPVRVGVFLDRAALERINAAPRERFFSAYREYRAGAMLLVPVPRLWRAAFALAFWLRKLRERWPAPADR